MAKPGPQKINRYGVEFKLRAVQISNQPGVLIKDVAESLCIADDVRRGRRDWATMEDSALRTLDARGWKPDYASVRRRSDLATPADGDALVVLAAARLGTTRLIDNLELDTLA